LPVRIGATLRRSARSRLARRDAAQDAAVDGLSRTLVLDGQPRKNPFNGLRVASPAVLVRLAVADEAKAIRHLAAAVQHREALSNATRQAARSADKAARAVETTLTLLGRQQATLRELRRGRDAIGKTWKTTLGALKRGARAAADDGAPHLHATLFAELGKSARTKRKRKRTAVAPTTTIAPA
jgi:hypothetical protein